MSGTFFSTAAGQKAVIQVAGTPDDPLSLVLAVPLGITYCMLSERTAPQGLGVLFDAVCRDVPHQDAPDDAGVETSSSI